MKIAWLLFVLVAVVKGCTGQNLLAAGACEEFNGAPHPCETIMSGTWSSVWTAPSLGVSQEFLHGQLLAGQVTGPDVFVSALDAIATLPYACAKAYSRVLCPTGFPPCVSLPGVGSVPLMPCRSLCDDANDVCLRHAGRALFNCSALSPITGGPQYPDDASGQCTLGPNLSSVRISYPCPQPMRLVGPANEDPYSGLPCSVNCSTERLYFSVGKSNFDSLDILLAVLAWISFVCTLLTIVVYTVYPNLREYPTRLVLFTAIGFFFVYLSFIGNSVQHPPDNQCDDENIYFNHGGWCRFAGFSLYLGAMIVATWWFWQAVVLFYNIGLQQHRERLDKKYEWVMHIWGWGYPIVIALLMMFLPGINTGAFGVDPWCFTDSADSMAWFSWTWIYGIFFLYILAFSLLLPVTLWRVISLGTRSTMKKKSMANFFLTILIFGIWYLIAMASVVIFRAYTWAVRDNIADSIGDYYACLLTSPDSYTTCGIYQQNMFPHYFFVVCIGLSGTIMFLLFVPFRERTRQTISQSFSNLSSGRNFLSGISDSVASESRPRSSASAGPN